MLLETRQTKAEMVDLADGFCRKAHDLEALFEALCSLSPKQQRQQYAGYVLLEVHRRCPDLLTARLTDLLSLLDGKQVMHESIPRQVFSVLQDRDLPEELAGEVFAKAVDYFLNLYQPIAARARALQTCANVAAQYSGLWPEVLELAREVKPHDPPGLRSIGARVASMARKKLS
jgi:hypothetical protein